MDEFQLPVPEQLHQDLTVEVAQIQDADFAFPVNTH
jgi:hypothetical protein